MHSNRWQSVWLRLVRAISIVAFLLLPASLLFSQGIIYVTNSSVGSVVIIRGPFPTNSIPFPRDPPSVPPTPVIFCPGPVPLHTNDSFANATILRGYAVGICGATSLATVVGGDGWQATAEPGEPPHGGVAAANSVWYRWTAPASGLVEIKAGGMLVAVYTGTTLGNLTPVTNLVQAVRFYVLGGQTYQIAIDRPVIQTPIGPITSFPGIFNLTLQLASVRLIRPGSTTGFVTGQPVEFEFAPFDATEQIAQLRAVAWGEVVDEVTNAPWQFTLSATNPGALTLWADGVNALGQHIIAWPTTFIFRPANDDFSSATPLADWATSGTFSADTQTATSEPGEPQPTNGIPAGHSVWWKWVAPYSAPTTLTLNSSFSKLTLFKGNSFESLERLLHLESGWLSGIIFPPQPPPYPTGSFQSESGATYYVVAESDQSVSWKLDQHTLELQPTAPQRGSVGVSIPVEAISIETDSPPVQVEFVLGQDVYYPFFPGSPQPSVPGWPFSQQITIGSLGSLSSPPYQLAWTPTGPGVFYISARSTNTHGEVHESSKTQFIVYAANDPFARASVIAPDTRMTNIAFDLAWGTAETNEPPHKTVPAVSSLWWKWTPDYSGSIRLKALQSNYGLPLDVFVGTTLADLRRIANNDRGPLAPGWSGLIRMRVKAGETYYIRADWFAYAVRGPGAIPGTLVIEPADAPMEATLNFSFFQNGPNSWGELSTHPRVLMADCRTPVTSSNFRAQLYVGQTANDLVPVGEPQWFFDDATIQQSPALAGRTYPSLVAVPGAKPGRLVFAQIRVWDSGAGSSYEEAQAAGGLVGASGMLKGLAGSEAVGPGPLIGLRPFCLGDAEPGHNRAADLSRSPNSQGSRTKR